MLALFFVAAVSGLSSGGNAPEALPLSVPAHPRVWEDEAMHGLELPLADRGRFPQAHLGRLLLPHPRAPDLQELPGLCPGPGACRAIRNGSNSRSRKRSSMPPGSRPKPTGSKRARSCSMRPSSMTRWSELPTSKTRCGTRIWRCGRQRDGTLPYFRYVVREKGKVELGTISCAMCHTRVMPDGTVIKGAQGNFPFEQAAEFSVRANSHS